MNLDLSNLATLWSLIGGACLLLVVVFGGVALIIKSSRKPNAPAKSVADHKIPDPPADRLELQKEDDEEEEDDPTAPISPIVAMSSSPHDSHRDLTVGNSLVTSIDLLDSLIRSGNRQSKADVVNQLDILQNDFVGLLKHCSFKPFEFESGTQVTAAMRSRIVIVDGQSSDGPTRIAETLRCGYLYQDGSEDPVIIRKAEVKIG